MPEAQTDLLRSSLELLILKALTWGPRHGYAVAEWIEHASGDTLLIEQGTLYPALHRLERKGRVKAEWGVSGNNRKAKFYAITPAGRAQLRHEVSVWHGLVAAIGQALGAASPEVA